MLTRRQRWLRGSLLGVLLLLALFMAVPLFVDVNDYRPDIELQLGAAINHDVTIDTLSLRTVPSIRLVASGIHINKPGHTASTEVKVARLDIYPNLAPLLDGEVDINTISLHDVVVRQGFIEAMAALGDDPATDQGGGNNDDFAVSIRHVRAEQVSVILDDITTIGPYRVDITLDKRLSPGVIQLVRMDDRARLKMVAVKQGYLLALKASDWTLPVGPALVFDGLDAEGLLDDMGVRITAMKADAYQGELGGMTAIDWANGWHIEGSLTGKGIDSEPLLAVFLDQPVISGRFNGGFHYTLRAKAPAQLGDRPRIEGDFMFTDGVIYNADLEKATNLLNSDAVKGGQTPFSQASGYLEMQNNNVLVKDLKVTSAVLEASGKVGVDAKDNLAGVIEVGVSKTGSLVSVPIKIAGTVDDPSLRPTNEAIAGGAVGTGLLGPGVGTAVGVKIGSFFGSLFDSDADEAATAAEPEAQQSAASQDEVDIWESGFIDED